MEAIGQRKLEQIRGRIEGGMLYEDDAAALIEYIDFLHEQLDEADEQDTFGTEGWRRSFGVDDV